MKYQVELMPKAKKDLSGMPAKDRDRMLERLRLLEEGLGGGVKKLTNHVPAYRLRSGDWRALFELEGNEIIVYRVLNRRDAYS